MDWSDLVISAVFIALTAGCTLAIRWLTGCPMLICAPAGVLLTLLVVFGAVSILANRTR